MHGSGQLQLLIYLIGMIVVVPISKRLGLGAVLGYLIAGVLLGPQVSGLLGDTTADASHLAEFGVITMLMMIGLELNPRLLWRMRGPIFGLGSAQVVATVLVATGLAMAAGIAWDAALTIGMVLSVSSTAIVLPTLEEKGFRKSHAGERTFAVLLFQDLAVIPMLAVIPFLASRVHPGTVDAAAAPGGAHGWKATLLLLGAVVALIGSGRLILRPAFRIVARLKLRDTFTVLALAIVVGSSALMQAVGLSPALGAFLAGVILADSEYRHQIEADLEPFRGLLLGLFFMSIGAGIDLRVVTGRPLEVAALVSGLILLKGALVYGIGRVFRLTPSQSFLFGISLAQGGEFAFVLLGLATAGGIIEGSLGQLLTASVALSMAVAPLLIGAGIRWGLPHLAPRTEERPPDAIDHQENPVVVIGIGRFGQVIVRLLRANGFKTTVLDYDAEQIEVMERFGIKSYFGDGSRIDLLRAAGIEQAKILVLALDDKESALRIVDEVRLLFPHLKIYARAFDRVHAYKLLHKGVHECTIETGGSAVNLGISLLEELGFEPRRAYRQGQIFRKYNERSLREMAGLFHQADRSTFLLEARQRYETLDNLMRVDAVELSDEGDDAWEAPPRSATQAEDPTVTAT